MSEFRLRVIVGLLLVVLAVGTAWLGGYIFALFVAAAATAVYWEWSRLAKGWGLHWHVLGFLYCLVPALALLWVRERSASGFDLAMWIFIVTWATDVGGYVVGKSMGRNKLAPRLSPNKTWEGLFGGMVFAALFGGLWVWLTGLAHSLYMLAPFAAIAAQAGDLFESGMKRRAGVKDSGKWLPGHGGFFDRLDGLLAVATLTGLFVYMHWL